MVFVKDDIVKVAKELGFDMKELDGKSYNDIHQKILEEMPNLHTREELKALAEELTEQILDNYGFDSYRIFAGYPTIRTKGYCGFDEVYLYKKIHKAMSCTAEAFCYMNHIEHDVDKAILEHEFSKIYGDKYGFLSLMTDDCEELITILKMVERHNFDPMFIKCIEIDLQIALVKAGDKFFHKQDLSNETIMEQLFKIAGEHYGFDGYRFDIFRDYDGYGNVVLNI